MSNHLQWPLLQIWTLRELQVEPWFFSVKLVHFLLACIVMLGYTEQLVRYGAGMLQTRDEHI